ncbi:MAG: WYL domain-containing protein [Coriobacteriia bacterium]|nr:WYL domain-containing protein [Coriobacteriia bacterium]
MQALPSEERLVNLALAFLSAKRPLTAQDIQFNSQIGYDQDAHEAAFKKMFFRDKQELAQAGIIITTRADNTYALDDNASYVSDLDLDPLEIASVRAIAYSLMDDPNFPLAHDLRFALAKLTSSLAKPLSSQEEEEIIWGEDGDPFELDMSRDSELEKAQADKKDTGAQDKNLLLVQKAVEDRKFLKFDYTNASGKNSTKQVEPLATFSTAGRWYLLARDSSKDDLRVFRNDRMTFLRQVNTRAKADFTPVSFDVRDYIGLPFMYGDESFEARIKISAQNSWRLAGLTKHKGELHAKGDDFIWTIEVKDSHEFIRFILAQEFDLEILEPQELKELYIEKIKEVYKLHG